MMKRLLIILCLAFNCCYAVATVLDNFLAKAKTFKANFTQTISSGKKTRTTHGVMEIARPNKFRWEYVEDKQLIISDGYKVYIYDEPLQQVTIKLLGASIDKSPAAVLAGANDLKTLYKITPLKPAADGLSWVKIEPRQANENNGFQVVQLGFAGGDKLAAMQFIDNFGNQSLLKFTNLQTGINLNSADFKFKAPAGVDIVEQ